MSTRIRVPGRAQRRSAVLVVVCLAVATGAVAATIHVPADRPTIAAALAVAQAGDQVYVAPGTYHEHDLAVPSDVVLIGTGADATDVVIDAEGSGRVVVVDGAAGVTIANLTLTGGQADRGGGLLASASTLVLSGCYIVDSDADYGGGLYLDASSACSLQHCLVARNTSATFGGGAFVHGGSSLVLASTVLASNDATAGGGAWYAADGGAISATSSTIADNVAELGGEGAAFLAGALAFGHLASDRNHGLVVNLPGRTEGDGDAEYYLLLDAGSVPSYACSVRHSGGFVGPIAGQAGVDGNVDADPRLCRTAGFSHLDLRFGVAADSPCLPENSQGCELIGAYGLACETPTDVPADLPRAACVLHAAAPNPFNPATVIRFDLREGGRAQLAVYDLTGRRVAMLVDETLVGGDHEATWRSLDDRGRPVASGVYLCRLVAGGTSVSRSVTLVK